MRPKERAVARQIARRLADYETEQRQLPGIASQAARSVLIERILESLRRIEYVRVIRQKPISLLRVDPTSPLFHPIKAAIYQYRLGNAEEAFWLVFLSVHFGRHGTTNWQLLRDVYGGLGQGGTWDWVTTSADPMAFRNWLDTNLATLKGGDGVRRHFGNHRKYQSLDAWKPTGTGQAIHSYINWVAPDGSQQGLFAKALRLCNNDPMRSFDWLYSSMSAVASFGRTARFDFLTMVAKVGLADIEPPVTYLDGATGPLSGARLLFGASPTADLGWRDLQEWLVTLGTYLGVGMQVLEDSLCNWQKNPTRFFPFRG